VCVCVCRLQYLRASKHPTNPPHVPPQDREAVRRALAHFTGQGLVRAWGAWEEHLEHLRIARRGLAGLLLSGLSRGFGAWLAYGYVRSSICVSPVGLTRGALDL